MLYNDYRTIRINTNNTILTPEKDRKLIKIFYQAIFASPTIGLPELTINGKLQGYQDVKILSNYNSTAGFSGTSGSDMVDVAFTHGNQSMYLIEFLIPNYRLDQELNIVITDTGTSLRRVWITTKKEIIDNVELIREIS